MMDFGFAILEDRFLVKGLTTAGVAALIWRRRNEWSELRVSLRELASSCRLRFVSDEEAELFVAEHPDGSLP
jgi:hypothetical protein